MNFYRTKIICTIGPAVRSKEMIRKLIEEGMNVARLNFSHGNHEEHSEVIQWIREIREEMDTPVSIMLDTKGPEVRIGEIDGQILHLPKGHRWLLIPEEVQGDANRVTVTPSLVLERLHKGVKVLFDDGYITSTVIEQTDEGVVVEIENGGVIKSKKGINVPNQSLNLPFITDKDVVDIQLGCKFDVDLIAASFVRSAENIISIRELLEKEGKPEIMIVAKIENFEGVQNYDSIVQVADGIMIARGDLGVEVPLSQVPKLQKMMIRKACIAGKPTVTATQMLESMIQHPRPTRAETSDVANAIYDNTSAVMLSGETAVGNYPLETVAVMRSIILETEKDLPYREFFDAHSQLIYNDVPSAITLATVKTSYSTNARAIFAFSSSGTTAKLLGRFRPRMPVIAMTPNRKSFHQLGFFWGIVPFYSQGSDTVEDAFDQISQFGLDRGYVGYGDLVVVTAGTPFGEEGTTNMMIVDSIGNVLVRGFMGSGPKVHGNIHTLFSSEAKKDYDVRGKILVLTRCDSSFLPYIRESIGVILENSIDDEQSESFLLKTSKEFSKPVIVRADGATKVLNNGQLVTLEPQKALIYKGVVL